MELRPGTKSHAPPSSSAAPAALGEPQAAPRETGDRAAELPAVERFPEDGGEASATGSTPKSPTSSTSSSTETRTSNGSVSGAPSPTPEPSSRQRRALRRRKEEGKQRSKMSECPAWTNSRKPRAAKAMLTSQRCSPAEPSGSRRRPYWMLRSPPLSASRGLLQTMSTRASPAWLSSSVARRVSLTRAPAPPPSAPRHPRTTSVRCCVKAAAAAVSSTPSAPTCAALADVYKNSSPSTRYVARWASAMNCVLTSSSGPPANWSGYLRSSLDRTRSASSWLTMASSSRFTSSRA
mmetsp:Transcript_44266/g.123117  ORF Transcript_44266/g.123117 Transcript_44266/m.123117 type:complete len:293 (+) Transcript_44266:574-1452(+)